jgi:hypothetical protein
MTSQIRVTLGMGLRLAVLLPAACSEPAVELPPIPSAEEVRRILWQSIESQDGFLVVRDTLLKTILVQPAEAPWAVTCKFGMGVTFGSGHDATVEVRISRRLIPDDMCYELATFAARTVRSIVAVGSAREQTRLAK